MTHPNSFPQPSLSGHYLPGPEPELASPDFDEAFAAETALEKALEKNHAKNHLVAGIQPAQAEQLLEWMVHKARYALLPAGTVPDSAAARKAFSKPLFVNGQCTVSQSHIHFQATLLGLKSLCHEVHTLTHGKEYGHSFSVIMLPIQKEGQLRVMPYLVDATFRQFFDPASPAHTHRCSYHAWGMKLTETPEGRALADALLTQGFTPLTPEIAQLYLGSAEFDRKTGEHRIVDHRATFATLLSHSTDPTTIPPNLLHPSHELRTPIMVQDEESLRVTNLRYYGREKEGEMAWWQDAPIHHGAVLKTDDIAVHQRPTPASSKLR